jgi:hypothetical protein
MMQDKWYRQTTQEEMKGRRVRLLNKIQNGRFIFKAGTFLTIQGKSGGLSLVTDECPCCGIRAFITKVSPGYVDLVEEVEK